MTSPRMNLLATKDQTSDKNLWEIKTKGLWTLVSLSGSMSRLPTTGYSLKGQHWPLPWSSRETQQCPEHSSAKLCRFLFLRTPKGTLLGFRCLSFWKHVLWKGKLNQSTARSLKKPAWLHHRTLSLTFLTSSILIYGPVWNGILVLQ